MEVIGWGRDKPSLDIVRAGGPRHSLDSNGNSKDAGVNVCQDWDRDITQRDGKCWDANGVASSVLVQQRRYAQSGSMAILFSRS